MVKDLQKRYFYRSTLYNGSIIALMYRVAGGMTVLWTWQRMMEMTTEQWDPLWGKTCGFYMWLGEIEIAAKWRLN